MRMSRRSLLASVSAVAMGRAAARPKVFLGAQTNAWEIDPANFDTLLDVLEKIRRIGYAGFETGFRNLVAQEGNPAPARKRIEVVGLEFFGVHIFLSQYDEKTGIAPEELYKKVARTGAALSAKRLILSGRASATPGAARAKAEALNRAGEFARKLGIGLAYHNHHAEFANGGEEMELLFAETDPALTGFLLDAGHAFLGRADVPAFVRKHSNRLVGIHLRDFSGRTQVPLGQGSFPLPTVAAALREANWSGWALSEEERASGEKPGEAAIAPAFAALRKAFAA